MQVKVPRVFVKRTLEYYQTEFLSKLKLTRYYALANNTLTSLNISNITVLFHILSRYIILRFPDLIVDNFFLFFYILEKPIKIFIVRKLLLITHQNK